MTQYRPADVVICTHEELRQYNSRMREGTYIAWWDGNQHRYTRISSYKVRDGIGCLIVEVVVQDGSTSWFVASTLTVHPSVEVVQREVDQPLVRAYEIGAR